MPCTPEYSSLAECSSTGHFGFTGMRSCLPYGVLTPARQREVGRRAVLIRPGEKKNLLMPPWSFRAMAFGTWGGVGPEGIKTLSRILQRSAGWLEGDMRASRQEELRYFVGLTLMRQVWELLARKNFL